MNYSDSLLQFLLICSLALNLFLHWITYKRCEFLYDWHTDLSRIQTETRLYSIQTKKELDQLKEDFKKDSKNA